VCGIFGIATKVGGRVGVDRVTLERLRDLMAHRGPDGAGAWEGGHVALAHRRLAVIDLSPAGAQPLGSPEGRGRLVYNGELYNDAEVRRELAAAGVTCVTASDTETVLGALRTWGLGALSRLRGMYAIGFHDARRETLLLARDPLGVKPLYWTRRVAAGVVEVAFASEVRPLLGLPWVTARPDLVTVSSYLGTIRTTLGRRTLFEGVSTLLPGEAIEFDLRTDDLRATSRDWWAGDRKTAAEGGEEETRRVVRDSVRVHLRSDVPTCALLSGGLDSSILATVAMEELGTLNTYCSGAAGFPGGAGGDDFEHARSVADRIGSVHAEAPVTASLFGERWPAMVEATGLPLSTPNEVAINEVARRLRADGKIVTLSGEGADELLGGYEGTVARAAAYVDGGGRDGGVFHLDDAAWVPREVKRSVLASDVWRGLEGDAVMLEQHRTDFAESAAGGGDPLEAHLRHLRRVNLAGLLLRLDSATMQAGVEGRTPFADARVAAWAEGLPIGAKFDRGGTGPGRTKVCLRRAFAAQLPAAVATRAKASFPLPFEGWLAAHGRTLTDSAFAREVFTPEAVSTVGERPGEFWRFAWPMINLARWGGVWWG